MMCETASNTPCMLDGSCSSLLSNSSSKSFSPARRPDDLDIDVEIRLETRKADHALCDVHHANRRPHIEDVDPAAALLIVQAASGAVEHELDRLVDGHEEALDILVGHRQRATAAKLALKERNERSTRSQHVAEPHGHEPRRVRDVALRRGRAPGNRAHPVAWSPP